MCVWLQRPNCHIKEDKRNMSTHPCLESAKHEAFRSQSAHLTHKALPSPILSHESFRHLQGTRLCMFSSSEIPSQEKEEYNSVWKTPVVLCVKVRPLFVFTQTFWTTFEVNWNSQAIGHLSPISLQGSWGTYPTNACAGV